MRIKKGQPAELKCGLFRIINYNPPMVYFGKHTDLSTQDRVDPVGIPMTGAPYLSAYSVGYRGHR